MTALRTDLQNAFETSLDAEMGPAALTASTDSIGVLTSPCYIVIEMESDSQREYMLMDGSFGASSFVTTNIANRYLGGSAAGSNLTHPIGSSVQVVAMSQHFEDLHDRIDGLDHGDLTGLGDDDHAMYSFASGARAFTGEVAGITPTADASLATKGYADGLVVGLLPAGIVSPFAGASPPSGWLLCNGQSIATSSYGVLFAAIGYVYGGSGANFNVPDMRQRFPLGKADSGTGSSLGDAGGDIDHTHSGASHTHTMGTHNHSMAHTHQVDPPITGSSTDGDHTHSESAGSAPGAAATGPYDINNAGDHTHTTNIGQFASEGSSAANTGNKDPGDTNSGGSGSTGSGNPPFLALLYVIKT
jgi:microcystin-dependent protein